jgi:transcriptional regulator with XRE-family HTH domain
MSEETLKALGARIRTLRRAGGASQEGFARTIGMDRAYFGRIERGAQNISVATAARIAAALGVSMSELFEVTPPPS